MDSCPPRRSQTALRVDRARQVAVGCGTVALRIQPYASVSNRPRLLQPRSHPYETETQHRSFPERFTILNRRYLCFQARTERRRCKSLNSTFVLAFLVSRMGVDFVVGPGQRYEWTVISRSRLWRESLIWTNDSGACRARWRTLIRHCSERFVRIDRMRFPGR